MSKITYPTQNIVDSYLGYSNALQSIPDDLGYTRHEKKGFTLRKQAVIPRVNATYTQINPTDFIGVDYPCLIEPEQDDIKSENKDGIGKTIAIIGQDPRRGTSDRWFKNPSSYFNPTPNMPINYNDEVVFGLPWAVNKIGYLRDKTICYHLVNELLGRGFSIYFTDMFKLYNSNFGDKNFNSCMGDPNISKDALDLLKDELGTIKPVRILILGQKPFNNFKKLGLGLSPNVIVTDNRNYVQHPSPKNPNWPKLGRNKDDQKAKYYVDLIEKSLKDEYILI